MNVERQTERRNFDRRNSDRIKGDRPKRASAQGGGRLGILCLSFILLLTSLGYWFESSNSAEFQQAQKSKVQQQKEKVFGNKTYQEFRDDVLQRDHDLIAKHKAKKEERRRSRPIIDPEQFRRDRVEKQIADLEYSLKSFKKSSSKKGSIGWGIKKDIERLKKDPEAL